MPKADNTKIMYTSNIIMIMVLTMILIKVNIIQFVRKPKVRNLIKYDSSLESRQFVDDSHMPQLSVQ